MASYTPNINLKKPTTDEYYNVLDENQNKDKIDTAIGTINSQLGKAYVHAVQTSTNAVASFEAKGNGNFILLFYAGNVSSIFLGGQATSLYVSIDDPTQKGFTLARNDRQFTLTRTNGNDFQFAWLEID